MYNCCRHCVHWERFDIPTRTIIRTPQRVVNNHWTPCPQRGLEGKPSCETVIEATAIPVSIRCRACDSHRVFGKDEFDYRPQIKWGKHAPTLENTIIKAMTAQQPNTPVNMRMVERLASEIQASWLMQPTMQEQELQEEGR